MMECPPGELPVGPADQHRVLHLAATENERERRKLEKQLDAQRAIVAADDVRFGLPVLGMPLSELHRRATAEANCRNTREAADQIDKEITKEESCQSTNS